VVFAVITMFTEKMESTSKMATTMLYSQMEEPAKITHLFHIGDSRNVYVNEDNDVTNVDDQSGKRAFFVARRWVRFVQEILNINKAV